MAAEAIGLTLAVGGILLAFKGAVDGCNLLCEIFASDTGLRFASVRYRVESDKLTIWGERVMISSPTTCLLLKEPEQIRNTIAGILTEMNAAHEFAIEFLNNYEMELQTVSRANGIDEEFGKGSPWMEKWKQQREKMKQKKRLKWATKDRDRFMELIGRLEKLNQNLWELIRTEESDTIRIVTGVLAGLHQQLDLSQLQQQVKEHPESLLALSVKLKQMQLESVEVAAARVKKLTAEEFQVMDCGPEVTNGRYLGLYHPGKGLPERVWLEWRSVSKDHPYKEPLITRILALGALLSSGNSEEFHRPACVGVFDDEEYETRTEGDRRLAFVYQMPTALDRVPTPFLGLLKEAKKSRTRPALGERFEMAYKLASAVSLLHAANWIHKSFRSDNILFTSPSEIKGPLISGFQYSRPAQASSYESNLMRQELDIYYHPASKAGWSKLKDLYSLGIVLLEVAWWRPVFEERFKEMNAGKVSETIIEDLNGKFGDDLIGMVGKVFVDVIKCCLTGDFSVQSGDSESESRILSKMFFLKVVQPLQSCKA